MNRTSDAEQSPAEQQYVSTAQVATALGVSVTTVKRWVDDGVLPAHRTAGGHRKLLLTDVLRLVRDGNLPQADLTKLLPKGHAVPVDSSGLLQQLISSIRSGDADNIRNLIVGGYQAGMPIEMLADKVISPSLLLVGREWSAGKLDVMREHRVTQACISAFYELQALLRVNADPNRPVAVGCAPEHDHYVLPTLLAKLTLLDAGWDAINLGPHTPFSALSIALDQLNPSLIWLSITHLSDSNSFQSQYRAFYTAAEQRGVAVALGGRGLGESLRSQLPYTAYGDGFTQLAAFAKTLHRRPGRPKLGRPPGTGKKSPEDTSVEMPALSDPALPPLPDLPPM